MEKGERLGLEKAIAVLDLPFSADRRALLQRLSLSEWEDLRSQLKAARAWPVSIKF